MPISSYEQEYRGWHFPTVRFALDIHDDILKRSKGLPGIRDEASLASAIEAPHLNYFGEDVYKTLFTKVAAMGFLIVNNHPFTDGNKRTALVVTVQTLDWNGFAFNASLDDTVELLEGVAMKRYSIAGFRAALIIKCGHAPDNPNL